MEPLIPNAPAAPRLAVYVHFPWCLQRCPYCDFATEAVQPERIPHARYAAAVVREFAMRRAALAAPLRPTSLFFGGGTPSLWDPAGLGAVLGAVRACGPLDEVTVECNPTSLDAARCDAWRAAGVDRLSIGVQSLRDSHLRYLGRLHDAGGAARAVATAVGHGGFRVSADLMFGLADQTLDEALGDLGALVDAGVEHVSCYALTIESGTRFGELSRKGKLRTLEDVRVAEMYLAIEAACEARGLAHYEVSNYARPGAASVHNEAYWRGDAYLGLGAGAVGCVPADALGHDAVRWRNDADAARYCDALERGELPPGTVEPLDAATRVREALMLGLRTERGVHLREVERRTGLDARAGRERAIAHAYGRGNLEDHGDRLTIPRSRWLHADDIVARLF